jgi:hypothetical protein
MFWAWLFIPACIHCRHYKSYLPSRNYNDLGKCLKFNQTRYAEQMRYDETKCGIRGTWFES